MHPENCVDEDCLPTPGMLATATIKEEKETQGSRNGLRTFFSPEIRWKRKLSGQHGQGPTLQHSQARAGGFTSSSKNANTVSERPACQWLVRWLL
jgi:hypothetical protein